MEPTAPSPGRKGADTLVVQEPGNASVPWASLRALSTCGQDLIFRRCDSSRLLQGHRPSLFPRVPVVYALVSTLELPGRPIPTDVISILDRFDLANTLDMARHLQPDARRVDIVAGADAFDTMWENFARRDLHPSAGGLEFRYSRVCRCLVAAGARPTVIFITGFDEPRARKRASHSPLTRTPGRFWIAPRRPPTR